MNTYILKYLTSSHLQLLDKKKFNLLFKAHDSKEKPDICSEMSMIILYDTKIFRAYKQAP